MMIFIESRLTQESSCLAEILVERSTLSRIGLLRAYSIFLFRLMIEYQMYTHKSRIINLLRYV